MIPRIRSTHRPSRLEVDKMKVPVAEINSAGVIMAVKTASADESEMNRELVKISAKFKPLS